MYLCGSYGSEPMDLPLWSMWILWLNDVIWMFTYVLRECVIYVLSECHQPKFCDLWSLKILEIYVSLKILCYICVMLCDLWKFLHALKQRCHYILFFQCIMNFQVMGTRVWPQNNILVLINILDMNFQDMGTRTFFFSNASWTIYWMTMIHKMENMLN